MTYLSKTLSLAIFTCLLCFLATNRVIASDLSHHITGVKPSQHINIPKAWPLEHNKLACHTCHGDKNIANKAKTEVDRQAANFLRQGPYPKLQMFCQHCHQRNDYQANNIHQMLDRLGEIKRENCLYCHNKVPERNDKKRAQLALDKQAQLRLSSDKLCFGCHLKVPHFNALEHQGKASDNILAQIKHTEEEQNISLPLSQHNEVICISCHNPHQRGVLNNNSAKGKQVANADLARGVQYKQHSWNNIVQRDKQDRLNALSPEYKQAFNYQQITHEVLLRLPAKNGELCLACHTFSH